MTSQGQGQQLLVEALKDLVLELEAARVSKDKTNDAQFLVDKVLFKAQSVICQLEPKSSYQPTQSETTNLKSVNGSSMENLSELLIQPVDSSSPSVGVVMVIPSKKCKPKINSKQSAMLNHVVLSCVFKRMNAADLLHLRPVCKKWDLVIMETISNPANGKFLKATLNEFNIRSLILSDLNQILGSSRKFPISTLQLSLDILDWDWGRDVDISLFSDIHGAHIKTLIIKDCDISDQAVNFLDLLKNQFPHVEHLILKTMQQNIRVFDDPIGEMFTHMSLPTLKTLDFDGNESISFQMYLGLIRSAVNLESVTGQSRMLFMALRYLHKGGLMKKARVSSDTETSNTETINVISLAGLGDTLKLTHLDIDRVPSPWLQNFTQPLTQILLLSKTTLESLRIPAFKLGWTRFTGITELPNLKRLHLYHPDHPSKSEGCSPEEGDEKKERMRFYAIFPEGTILAKKFPQLNTLVLQLPVFSKRSIAKYFPRENYCNPFDKEIDVLATLQNLELDCKMTIFGLKSLARKFPNVRSIKAKNIYDIFGEHDCRWYLPWANLEALELGGFRFDNDLCLYSSLDSFFTGFSEDICRNLVQLRKAGAGAGTGRKYLDANIQILQTRGSLRDLQNLKKLKLVFDHESNSEWGAKVVEKFNVSDNEGEGLITELTLEYAFNVMPKLHRVIIAYDHHRQNSAAMAAAFKPLTDFAYVTFDHEPLT